MVGVQAAFEIAAGNTAGPELNATATLPIDYNRKEDKICCLQEI
jgi:hypothetical protein